MASSEEDQSNLQNISEAEARNLVSKALERKDLSKIKALAATNAIIHKVFAQLVKEMVGNEDQTLSASKPACDTPSSSQLRMNAGNSQNGSQYQMISQGEGQLARMLNASIPSTMTIRTKVMDSPANHLQQQVRHMSPAPISTPVQQRSAAQQPQVVQGMVVSGAQQQQVQRAAPVLRNVQQQQHLKHLQPQPQQQYVVMSQSTPVQQQNIQYTPQQQQQAQQPPQTGMGQIRQFMIQTEPEQQVQQVPQQPARKVTKRGRGGASANQIVGRAENVSLKVANQGVAQQNSSFNLSGAMAMRQVSQPQQIVVNNVMDTHAAVTHNHIQQQQQFQTRAQFVQQQQLIQQQAPSNQKQLTAQQIQQQAIMKAQQIHKSASGGKGSKQHIEVSVPSGTPRASLPPEIQRQLDQQGTMNIRVLNQPLTGNTPRMMNANMAAAQSPAPRMTTQAAVSVHQPQQRPGMVQAAGMQQVCMPSGGQNMQQIGQPQHSQTPVARQVVVKRGNQPMNQQQMTQQQYQQMQQQLNNQQHMQQMQHAGQQQGYVEQSNMPLSQTQQQTAMSTSQKVTPHQEAFLNFTNKVRTQDPSTVRGSSMQGNTNTQPTSNLMSPQIAMPGHSMVQHVGTPMAPQRMPLPQQQTPQQRGVAMVMSGQTPVSTHPMASGGMPSNQSIAHGNAPTTPTSANAPNVTPLSSQEQAPAPAAMSGAQGNLVKDSEYLIQYSNGRKVVGVWDGKFFKIKTQNPAIPATGGASAVAKAESPAQVVPQQQQPTNHASQVKEGVTNARDMNLARRGIHEQAGQTASPGPVMPDLVPIQSQPEPPKPAIKRPPRPREEGKFAICTNCGNQSADYETCDSCKKPLPEDAKLYAPDAATARKKARLDDGAGGTPRLQGKVKDGPVMSQGEAVIDKKAFYGKAVTSTSDSDESSSSSGRGRGRGTGRGARTPRGRGRGVPNRSPEIETVVLSSDEDEDGTRHHHGNHPQPQQPQGTTPQTSQAPPTTSAAQPPANIPKRVKMDEEASNAVKKAAAEAKMKQLQQLQQQQLRKQEIQQHIASQDMTSVLVQLVARSIRIGSFRGMPTDAFKLTVQGVQFTIQWGADCLQIHIGANEVVSALCHFGEQMPCMFLQTTPGCAQRLREALHMEDPNSGSYYDPNSNSDVNKYITVIFESLGDTSQGIESYFMCIFSVMQDHNPVFKNGGQLLKEIDYQEANDLLINSTPQAQLQLMNLGLGGLLEGEDEDEPVDRSRSPSPPRMFTGKVIKLFTYPPPPATGGINVTNEDLFCLNEGEFLNDVIIDFYLKYICREKLDEDTRKRTHIFSSFFYRRLTLKENKRANDPSQNIQQRRHARVKTWSRHFDIFKKDFIIVPINESAHWYLAIICYPGLLEPVYADSPSPTPTPTPTPSSGAQTPVPNETEKADGQKEGEKKEGGKDILDDIQAAKSLESQENGGECSSDDKKSESSQSGKQRRIEKQPCILVFDSLAGPSRSSVVRTLREYLQVEWDVKKKEKEGERVLDKDNFKGCSPRCPQQLNFSDCGVFVLQYVESFFSTPIKDYALPIQGLSEWFSEETALYKREELRILVMSLKDELNPSLEYDPASDGIAITLDDELDEDFPHPGMVANAANMVAMGTQPGVNPQQLQLALAATQSGQNVHQQMAVATANQQLMTVNQQQMTVANLQHANVANQQMTVAVANVPNLMVGNRSVVVAATTTPQQQGSGIVAHSNGNASPQMAIATGVNQIVQAAPVQMTLAPVSTPQIQIASVTSGHTQFFSQDSQSSSTTSASSSRDPTPPHSSAPSTPKSASSSSQASAKATTTRVVQKDAAKAIVARPAISNATRNSTANSSHKQSSGGAVKQVTSAPSLRNATTTQDVHNVVTNIVNTVLKQAPTKTS